MNVLVVTTGRSGSLAFARACKHITNYTVGHESHRPFLGQGRFAFASDNHIEVDNRLAWFTGRLDKVFGDNAFYVHLRRNRELVAKSYNRRWGSEFSIVRAYGRGILMRDDDSLEIVMDMIETIETNIELFLRDKERVMTVDIEDWKSWFPRFWEAIGAEGQLEEAMAEFAAGWNRSSSTGRAWLTSPGRVASKISRIIRKLPRFIVEA